MVFYPPSWVPKLPEVPDTVSIPDFLFDEQYGRKPFDKSWESRRNKSINSPEH
jgi:hypothetical protein